MAQLKKILVSLPDDLLKEIDSLVSMEENGNRREFVLKAIEFYIREKQKIEMGRGYLEMADINIEFAREFLEADNEQLEKYEQRLREMGQ